ncbi:hypothetical protein E2P81_ATG02080 [Venturia nashicola]|uniref:Uncharacterized protein n=1 Tax=Venturia nashicola TaxID=86259 RepID=A0A4Z1P4Q2_9PEZI|nr:hypothetical protein E6O75_ATG02129 [Venturia nashicola]TLD35777.1 hypothetical protein E2P81_ATG02080 [Venturia nashicola]
MSPYGSNHSERISGYDNYLSKGHIADIVPGSKHAPPRTEGTSERTKPSVFMCTVNKGGQDCRTAVQRNLTALSVLQLENANNEAKEQSSGRHLQGPIPEKSIGKTASSDTQNTLLACRLAPQSLSTLVYRISSAFPGTTPRSMYDATKKDDASSFVQQRDVV